MKNNETIGITFNIPKKTYYGLKTFLNVDSKTLSRFISACAINRLIDKGYLNELGEPIELPKLELTNLSQFSDEGFLNIYTS